ncbi:DMT family transporter [Aestuariispira insulae]|uniref:EamA-like transporter family protein n=1 Tax=Aestuariispira insulae TaxID=1461337 RepID=A0A3D9HF81_9PROT|nr:DMT family transporter [Aestuariispira insulae]RED48133.1 EamA-like transporter family protein [Aestuariispira insulae]
MGLDGLAILMVLAAAVLHASWNALVKSAADRVLTFATLSLGGMLAGMVAVPFLEVPDHQAWPYLIASTLVHYGYYAFLILSYRHGDLSQVYPLARGAAPLLVAAGAWIFAGEMLSPMGMMAVMVTSAGIMMLAFEGGWPRGRDRTPVLLALVTGCWIAGYTVLDGMGVRRSGAPISYILWLYILEGLPFLVWVLLWKRRAFVSHLKRNWITGLGGAMASNLAYGLVIFAMSLGSMAAVSSIRETSSLLATVIAAVVLKESFTARRYLAAGLVSIGVVVLNGWA